MEWKNSWWNGQHTITAKQDPWKWHGCQLLWSVVSLIFYVQQQITWFNCKNSQNYRSFTIKHGLPWFKDKKLHNNGWNFVLQCNSIWFNFNIKHVRWQQWNIQPNCTERGNHDDVIKWKHFPRYWSFLQGIHPHKGQWRRALMFSLICAQINSWVNNGEAGDLRCNRAHYDVIVMACRNSNLMALLHWHNNHITRMKITWEKPNLWEKPKQVLYRRFINTII